MALACTGDCGVRMGRNDDVPVRLTSLGFGSTFRRRFARHGVSGLAPRYLEVRVLSGVMRHRPTFGPHRTTAPRLEAVDCCYNDYDVTMITLAPLIGALSNGRIGTMEGELARLGDLMTTDSSRNLRCGCGCGQSVTGDRKFVGQAHYNAWLSAERYIGRNLRDSPSKA